MGPKWMLADACVATAPLPGSSQGTIAPTHIWCVCTATPSWPVAASRATML